MFSKIYFKKIFLFLILFLYFNSVSASIEDNSIIKELDNNDIKELNLDFKLKSFESCNSLEDVMGNYIKQYWSYNKDRSNYPVFRTTGMEVDMVEDFSYISSSLPSNSSSNSKSNDISDYSETNTQVLGVDESDIIKTDGDYIYYYNDKGNYNDSKYVYVINSKDLVLVKKIKLPKFFYDTQIYVSKNRLIILASGYANTSSKKYINHWINRAQKTYTIVYDTTNKSSPALKKLYINDGNLSKSRKIGNYLYVISNNYFNIPYHNFKSEDDIIIDSSKIIPKKIDISKTSKKSKQNLKIKKKTYPFHIKSGNVANCNEIEYVLPDLETIKNHDFNLGYNIVSIIDIDDTEAEVKTKVIAGNTAEIYMSLDNLYLTDRIHVSYNYKCPEGSNCILPYYWGGTTNTIVHKLSISGNSLKYKDSNIVPGSPLNQYSMDEKDGKFRIITSINSWGENREFHTNLYVLNDDLNVYSSLTKLAPSETFRSSRFIGDKLYLVTFEQIDPLFVIDLKDQKNPKILGELKIPGYSTYLHPYDENHLIGLGYDTYQNKWGGVRNGGVKIDLYEINYDKTCSSNNLSSQEIEKCDSGDYKGIIVKQKYTKTFGDSGSYTEALNNPRMFIWNRDLKKLLLPISIYVNESKDSYKHIDFFNGVLSLNIDKQSGITQNYRITHIDTDGIEEKRSNECKKHFDRKEENLECKTLIDGSTYCPSKNNYYIPPYCYEKSTLESYIASKSWEFIDSFINRSLWIGDKVFAISNDKITKHEIQSGKKSLELYMR